MDHERGETVSGVMLSTVGKVLSLARRLLSLARRVVSATAVAAHTRTSAAANPCKSFYLVSVFDVTSRDKI